MKTRSVYASADIHALAAQLAHTLRQEHRSGGIFCEPVILVPNNNVKKWLWLFLARSGPAESRAACGLNFHFLEKGIRACWNTDKQLLDQSRLEMLIAGILLDREHIPPGFDAYIREHNSENAGYERRLWQLAGKLAKCFFEYMYTRSGASSMLEAWMQGRLLDPSDPIEAAEQALYMRIFGVEGPAGTEDSVVEALSSLVRGRPEGSKSIPSIHVYGFAHLSPLYLELLQKLNEVYNVHIYQFSMYAGSWSEQPPKDGTLSLWGRAADQARLLLQQRFGTAIGPLDHTAPPAEESLLSRLKSFCSGIPGSTRLQQDESIKVIGCPGMMREVEMIHNTIIQQLEADKNLKLTDIVILSADMASYAPIFAAVFGGRSPTDGRPVLPFSMSDLSGTSQSAFAGAVELFIALLYGPCSRADVFALLMNRCFQAAWDIDEEDVRTWASWVESLGVYRGFNEDAQDVYAWPQGLSRLRLGTVMQPPENIPFSGEVYTYHGMVPFADANTDTGTVDRLSRAMETLMYCVEDCKSKDRTAAEWIEQFKSCFDLLLAVPHDAPGELSARQKVYDVFDELSHMQCGRELAAAIPAEFIRGRLSGLKSSKGRYLTEGITISALSPMRPLPFKVMYISGLQEGNFPGQQDQSILDLRLKHPENGDLSEPDVNRNLFVEMLLCAQQRLILSYLSRDLQQDKQIFPCSVLNQLMQLLSESLCVEPFTAEQIPMHGHIMPQQTGKDIQPSVSPDERDLVLAGLANPPEAAAERALLEHYTKSKLDNLQLPATVQQKRSYPLRIPCLADFLEDPFKAGLRLHCRVNDWQDNDILLEEHEPFSIYQKKKTPYKNALVPVLDAAITRSMERLPVNAEALAEAARIYYANEASGGRGAAGPYREHDLKKLGSNAAPLFASIIAPVLSAIEGNYTGTITLEASGSGGAMHGPEIDAPENFFSSKICLCTELAHYWSGPDTDALVFVSLDAKPREGRDFLRTQLSWLAFAAAGHTGTKPCMVYAMQPMDGKYTTYSFNAVSRERALAYLSMLIEDFCGSGWTGCLPLHFMQSGDKLKGMDLSPEEYAAMLRDAIEESEEGRGYYPSVFQDLLGITVPDNAQELARRRILPLYREFMGGSDV